MIFADGVLGLALLGLWLFCLIDVITTPEFLVRNLAKTWWVLIVLILPDIGSVLWLVAGRTWNGRGHDMPYKGNRGYRDIRDAQNAARATARPRGRSNPDDDDDFQAALRARVAEQRRRAREADGTDEPA